MKKTFLLIILASCFLLPTPTTVLAQGTEYQLLTPLPNVETTPGSGKATATSYITGLFQLIIAIAGLLAVIMIIFGGIKYMSTDAFGGKNEAKATIEHAIWGLLLAASAWLILNTINPKLVNFNLNPASQPISTTPTGGTGTCSNCVTFQSLNIQCQAYGCSIDSTFGSKLALLNNTGIAWYVTEAYPPSSTQHVSACHNSGTCVDAGLSNPTAANINQFAAAATAAGLAASYEVKTTAEETTLINAGVNPSIISVNAGATGPHFHIK